MIRHRIHTLIVDDDSPDGTWRIVEEKAKTDPGVHLLRRTTDKGRGSAGAAAYVRALELGADVVGEMDDGLVFGFVADLRAAEDDFDVRPDAFDGGDDFGGWFDVPDVDAEADDFGITRQQSFRDVERTLIDVELDEARARLQVAQIGQQIAQAKRGVDVFRVERG